MRSASAGPQKPTLPLRFLLAKSAIFFSQSAIPMPVVPRSSATICAAAGWPFRMSASCWPTHQAGVPAPAFFCCASIRLKAFCKSFIAFPSFVFYVLGEYPAIWPGVFLDKKAAAVHIRPLQSADCFVLHFDNFHSAVCVFDYKIRRVVCSGQAQAAIITFRQKFKFLVPLHVRHGSGQFFGPYICPVVFFFQGAATVRPAGPKRRAVPGLLLPVLGSCRPAPAFQFFAHLLLCSRPQAFNVDSHGTAPFVEVLG
nr:MAG TPA: hypothetical protein [Caudoviricetes sp.]